VSDFSYTLESIIQAGKNRMAIGHVEVATNPHTRPSRLFDSLTGYVKRSGATIVRIYTMYEPLKVFSYIGALMFLVGFLVVLRFVWAYVTVGYEPGKIQSLILAAAIMIVGFQIILIGLVADAISSSRKLTEDLLYRLRKMELADQAARDAARRRTT
jgi:hypothetical protein